jgi:hypothetical protein
MLAPVLGARKDGRSSFRALKDYLAQEVDSETREIRPRGEVILSENLLSPETAAAEMRGVANENARVKDPVFHYQLCLLSRRMAFMSVFKVNTGADYLCNHFE